MLVRQVMYSGLYKNGLVVCSMYLNLYYRLYGFVFILCIYVDFVEGQLYVAYLLAI